MTTSFGLSLTQTLSQESLDLKSTLGVRYKTLTRTQGRPSDILSQRPPAKRERCQTGLQRPEETMVQRGASVPRATRSAQTKVPPFSGSWKPEVCGAHSKGTVKVEWLLLIRQTKSRIPLVPFRKLFSSGVPQL